MRRITASAPNRPLTALIAGIAIVATVLLGAGALRMSHRGTDARLAATTATLTPQTAPAQVTTSAAGPAPTVSPASRTTPAPAATSAPAGGGSASAGLTWLGHTFDAGVNVPWVQWGCDFGCTTKGGASRADRTAQLSSAFATVNAAGVHVVRWWMFEGDPWQIEVAADGTPTGIDPDVYADIDAALALARQYDLYFDFVLFSAPDAVPQSWFTSTTQRTALANALGQLFAHYADEPRIMSWEVFNEPEWDYWRRGYAQQPIIDLTRAVVQSIHAHSHAMATVGSAMIDALPDWVGVGLDYYQVHWYDQMASGTWCAICTDYPTLEKKYGLDAPLVIGEFYAGPDIDALARLQQFASKGYAGAWAWSLFPDHTSDKMAIDLPAYRKFTSAGAR